MRLCRAKGVVVLRFLRIAVLLYVLAFVAVGTFVEEREATNWDYALRVVVYPVAGDPGSAVGTHIDALTSDQFSSIETFFNREARRHGVELEQPVRVTVAPAQDIRLPELKRDPSRFDILVWSLRMRWTSMRLAWQSELPKPDITLFAVYHDTEMNRVLDSSTALRKGLIAIAHIFAARRQAGSNDVVMAHELLHTLGATDKYSFSTLQPTYPLGYAEPQREPLHPQRFTEIMGGRRAVSSNQAEMPGSLARVQIGATTAQEIGWRQPQ